MIFSILNLALTLGAMIFYGVVTYRKIGAPPVPVSPPVPQKAVSAPTVSAHRLVNTYVATGSTKDEWVEGWRFLCSCGARGTAANTVQQVNGKGGKLGTEASAIDKFILHRDKFLQANGDDATEHEDTAKLRKLEAEFAEWRNACFCKDTNDDLILLKHRHLDN